jgi:anti-repressor protein
LTTIVDGDGNPWWVASEVCKVLGYVNSPGAVAKHCKYPQNISVAKRDGIRGNPNKTIINESDLYRIITHSKLTAAKDFDRWVMKQLIMMAKEIPGGYPLYQILKTGNHPFEKIL